MAVTTSKQPKVQIVVSPVCDVLTGLKVVANPKEMLCYDEEEGVASSVLAKEASNQEDLSLKIKASLRPRLLASLEQFFGDSSYPGMGLLSLVGREYAQDMPSFLRALAQMPLDKLVTAMLAFGRIYRGNRPPEKSVAELMSSRELMIEYIERNTSVAAEQVGGLADLLMNPVEARDNLAELLEYFWYTVVAPEAEKRLQLQQQAAEQCQARLNEVGPLRLITNMTNLHPAEHEDFYEEVILATSSFIGGGIIGTENDQETCLIIAFGADNSNLKPHKEETTDEVIDTKFLAALYNTLSDEKRLQIVKALLERPHYGQELAKKFGISNATVFYHLSMLEGDKKAGVSLKLVHLERIEHRVYYVLNTERLHKLLAQGMASLVG